MATQDDLKLKLLGDSGELKLFQATSKTQSILSNHTTSGDAVVIVEEGTGILLMNGEKKQLRKGDFVIIHKGEEHSLEVDSNFRAKIAMSNNAEIQPR